MSGCCDTNDNNAILKVLRPAPACAGIFFYNMVG
jgi:hypothetical protein